MQGVPAIGWIESVQREVRHVGLELYAGGGSTEIADAVALEVQLLMNVPIDDSTHATVTVNYRQEGVLIVQTDVAHPARAARHWIVMQANNREQTTKLHPRENIIYTVPIIKKKSN